MTIEEAIKQYENSERMNKELAETSVYPTAKAYYLESAEKCKQMIEWLRELQERRKAPEIITCGECEHFRQEPDGEMWCGVSKGHGIDKDFFCGDAERRTDG